MSTIKRFLMGEDGLASVEYVLMLAIIFMTCLVSIRVLGFNGLAMWSDIRSMVTTLGY